MTLPASHQTEADWDDETRQQLVKELTEWRRRVADMEAHVAATRQVEQARRQKGHGSGLGLAFCKLAVEAHDVRLWVDNSPRQGATFTFSLAVASTDIQSD